MKTIGQELLSMHLDEMNRESRQEWPLIVEMEGFRIIEDRPYQGFDNDGHSPSHPWWTEPRFWCRSITVERISDGKRGWGIGPQADAYADAIVALKGK